MDIGVIQGIDRLILLAFNGSENLFLDNFVVVLTSAYTWIPLYFSLLYLVIKNNENWQKILLVIGAVAICLLLSNTINLGLVKPLVARLRPLEEPSLRGIISATNNYSASGYSFFSSHTSNAFVLAVFFSLLIRDKVFTTCMLIWCSVVSLTRIYLGVHYPSDVVVGIIFGSSIAVLVYFLYLRIYIRCSDKLHYISTKYTRTGYSFADIDVVISILILTFIYAAFRAVLSI